MLSSGSQGGRVAVLGVLGRFRKTQKSIVKGCCAFTATLALAMLKRPGQVSVIMRPNSRTMGADLSLD